MLQKKLDIEDDFTDAEITMEYTIMYPNLVGEKYFSNINDKQVKIEDVIKKYYSNKVFIVSNESTKYDTTIILYGEEDYENNFVNGRYAYANMDSAGRITCMVYADGGLKITFMVDAVSHVINQIFIM